jgi:hypothetical protein
MSNGTSVRSAIYYPHLGISKLELLKVGLLLWDDVEYIAPGEGFLPEPPTNVPPDDERVVRDAMELLLRPHVPTEDERGRAHRTVELLVESDLAERLRGQVVAEGSYQIYATKFNYETWQLLERSSLAVTDATKRDYEMPRTLGLIMMSVLADSCAGALKRTMTDEDAAYATITKSFSANTLGNLNDGAGITRLVDVALRVADLSQVPLRDLVEMRQREIREGAGASLTDFRRGFAFRIDSTAQSMAHAASDTDRRTIQQQFEDDMKADFARLNRDLRTLTWNVLFSKELIVGVLVGLGLLAVPAGQGFAGAVALTGAGMAYRRERTAAFQRHPMSWLHRSGRRIAG